MERVIDIDGRHYALAGHCDPRFEPVLQVFRENFELGGELGAAVSIRIAGKSIVDLWGGWADAARRLPWRQNSLVCVLSVGKGPMASCLHVLVDRGLVDLDAPVARYWPEFAQNAKGDIPVRWILDHRAGLPVVDVPVEQTTLYDWAGMTAALAAARPLWEPGTQAGYHLLTIGFLVGEIVRRVTGTTLGAYFHDEVARPYGIDFHFGLSEPEIARCAELVTAMPQTRPGSDLARWIARAYAQLPAGDTPNSERFRRSEIPAANGHGNAGGVAAFYAALLASDGPLSRAALDQAVAEQWFGEDRLLGRPYHAALGFLRNSPPYSYMGPNPGAFGHHGAGGSMGFGDPGTGLAFGYVTNRMSAREDNGPRARRLIDAAYAAL